MIIIHIASIFLIFFTLYLSIKHKNTKKIEYQIFANEKCKESIFSENYLSKIMWIYLLPYFWCFSTDGFIIIFFICIYWGLSAKNSSLFSGVNNKAMMSLNLVSRAFHREINNNKKTVIINFFKNICACVSKYVCVWFLCI